MCQASFGAHSAATPMLQQGSPAGERASSLTANLERAVAAGSLARHQALRSAWFAWRRHNQQRRRVAAVLTFAAVGDVAYAFHAWARRSRAASLELVGAHLFWCSSRRRALRAWRRAARQPAGGARLADAAISPPSTPPRARPPPPDHCDSCGSDAPSWLRSAAAGLDSPAQLRSAAVESPPSAATTPRSRLSSDGTAPAAGGDSLPEWLQSAAGNLLRLSAPAPAQGNPASSPAARLLAARLEAPVPPAAASPDSPRELTIAVHKASSADRLGVSFVQAARAALPKHPPSKATP